MTLLTILISLALERFLPPLEKLRSLEWFEHYGLWIRGRLRAHPRWQGIPALLLMVLLPVIAVGIVQTLFNDILDILGFAFSIAVLTYSLGPNNPLYIAHQYQYALEHDDEETAREKLTQLLQTEPPENEADQASALVETLLVQSHERLLGILFWLIVLGPMGAILYRLVVDQAMRERRNPDAHHPEFSLAATRLHDIMAWIPSHINAFCYAAMGSFAHALHAWEESKAEKSGEGNGQVITTPDSHGLLLRIGLSALQFDNAPPQDTHAVRETFALCLRSLVISLTLLALLTLAGWIP